MSDDFKLFIYLGVVAMATLVGASSVNIWFNRTIKKRNIVDSDTTNLRFLRYLAIVAIYTTGFLMAILTFPSLRTVAQTALGGAGVLAVVAAIASQEALANLVSGIFIIFFRPFKVGDTIELADTMMGTVVDITLRHTVIRNFENKMIVIPNSIINKEKLINANMGELKCCERIEINIAYQNDITLARKIMQEECEKHPLLIDNRTAKQRKTNVPLVKTALISLNDFSVTIRAWTWVKDFNDAYQIRWDIYESVKKRFENEGIDMPFHRNIILKQETDTKFQSFKTK